MARKKFYLPQNDTDLSTWLKNFSSKIAVYASKYNLTAEEVEKVHKGAAHLVYWISAAEQMKATAQGITAYKNGVRNGLPNGAVGQQPANITFSPPEDMGSGVVPYVLSIAGRIKKHQGYSIADGKDLGLEGAEQLADMATLVPAFKIKVVSGHPKLVWKKGIFDGIKIKVNRNYNPLAPPEANDAFEFLAINLQPDFTDKHELPPFGKSAVWAYVITYILGDEEVGNWTDPQMVTVTGTP